MIYWLSSFSWTFVKIYKINKKIESEIKKNELIKKSNKSQNFIKEYRFLVFLYEEIQKLLVRVFGETLEFGINAFQLTLNS